MAVIIKTPEQIEKMRRAGALAAAVIRYLDDHVCAGMTTEALDKLAHDYILAHDAIPAPLNYHGYPKSICTSVNHVICHGIPNERKLKKGDIVNVDVTVILDGYHGDTSKMYIIGEVSPFVRRLVDVTQECLYLGIAAVKPGNRLGDIGHAIAQRAHKENYGVVREYCGHGIGATFHEDPNILHYGTPGTGMVIKENMTFTIEPMINIGSEKTRKLSDGWTVITKDRTLSAQWEHTLVVTATGCEILTLREEEHALAKRYLPD